MAIHEPVESGVIARRGILRGEVQGLGIRPAIARRAKSLGIAGFVRNIAKGVQVHAEGMPDDLERFFSGLMEFGLLECEPRCEPAALSEFSTFEIVDSEAGGPLSALVPRDRAVCDDCLQESSSSSNPCRRGYPFNSCATCGPRYSILAAMPFDRSRTSMDDFSLCAACAREYRDDGDRRFHAETTSCAACGPKLWMTDGQGRSIAGDWRRTVRDSLLRGEVVGVRGIGGYQLLCDATNADAVRRLRQKKGRPLKPLAVLVADLAEGERLAFLDHDERRALTDPRNPIVIARARPISVVAASDVHPGTAEIGILLPTSPMHRFLRHDANRPLVCTSGNRDGDSIEIDPDSAVRRLGRMADLWLHHDRRIVRAIDDSVVRIMAGRASTIRLARGFAPLPIPLALGDTAILAAGGHLKSSIAWHNGSQACLGPHLGDLDSVHVLERYAAHVEDVTSLYGFTPEFIAADVHPDYATHALQRRQQAPTVMIQHHHAHVVSAMLGAGLMDREVLGVAWDGTGYGSDGNVWGGEFLQATAAEFSRVASLLPFRLPGGEAAIHEPCRVAISMALESKLSPASLDQLFPKAQIDQVHWLIGREAYSPWCTSVGRLFDAVGWILLGEDAVGFDGRAGMLLESIADRRDQGLLPLPWIEGAERHSLDWRPLIRALLEQFHRGASHSAMAMRFHRALANGIFQLADRYPHLPVVLTGGVFQNRLLVELVAEGWLEGPRAVARCETLVTPGIIPVNDGGLSAGQLAVAWARQPLYSRGGVASSCA